MFDFPGTKMVLFALVLTGDDSTDDPIDDLSLDYLALIIPLDLSFGVNSPKKSSLGISIETTVFLFLGLYPSSP